MTIPTQEACIAHWRSVLQAEGSLWRKVGLVPAKEATEDTTLETKINGVVETIKPCNKGDVSYTTTR